MVDLRLADGGNDAAILEVSNDGWSVKRRSDDEQGKEWSDKKANEE